MTPARAGEIGPIRRREIIEPFPATTPVREPSPAAPAPAPAKPVPVPA